jgi:hypothetical protein
MRAGIASFSNQKRSLNLLEDFDWLKEFGASVLCSSVGRFCVFLTILNYFDDFELFLTWL